MWISKHNRGGQSVLFWGWGEREKARTATRQGLGPRAERLGTGTGAGGLRGASWGPQEGGLGTPSHAAHTAWHARPAPTADTPALCTQLPWNPGAPSHQHPREAEPCPLSPPHGGHSPAASKAHPSGSSDAEKFRREIRGEARAEHGPLLRPQPPICATGPGVWPLWDRGRDG